MNGKLKPAVTASLVGTNSPEKHQVLWAWLLLQRPSASGHATKFLACYNVVTTYAYDGTGAPSHDTLCSRFSCCVRLNH